MHLPQPGRRRGGGGWRYVIDRDPAVYGHNGNMYLADTGQAERGGRGVEGGMVLGQTETLLY